MDVEAKDTAGVCLFFDNLYDSVYRTAVTKNSPHHQLWRNSNKVLETIYFVDHKTKKKCNPQPPTIKNWIISLKDN